MLEGRRSERRVLNLAADLREDGASIAEVAVANISQHGFLIQGDSGLELEIAESKHRRHTDGVVSVGDVVRLDARSVVVLRQT